MNKFHYYGIGSLVVLLAGFGILADEVAEGDTLSFDNRVLMALRVAGDPQTPIGPSWLAETARDITALGSFGVLTLLCLAILVYLVLARRLRTAAFLTACVVGGTIISTVLKLVFDRPRPDLTGTVKVFTASFPSGHATVSAVVYLTLGTILAELSAERGFRVYFYTVAIALTALVGLSRIYLGVHYPTDVLAGWSIGAAWALLCAMVFRVTLSPQNGSTTA
ncbi:MAG: phosphatase PAP2 family protein [Alphaproteobacteria bacterium]|nr:phosphatase PAP2 family protein [Alphaproteobacteria bacterium]